MWVLPEAASSLVRVGWLPPRVAQHPAQHVGRLRRAAAARRGRDRRWPRPGARSGACGPGSSCSTPLGVARMTTERPSSGFLSRVTRPSASMACTRRVIVGGRTCSAAARSPSVRGPPSTSRASAERRARVRPSPASVRERWRWRTVEILASRAASSEASTLVGRGAGAASTSVRSAAASVLGTTWAAARRRAFLRSFFLALSLPLDFLPIGAPGGPRDIRQWRVRLQEAILPVPSA